MKVRQRGARPEVGRAGLCGQVKFQPDVGRDRGRAGVLPVARTDVLSQVGMGFARGDVHVRVWANGERQIGRAEPAASTLKRSKGRAGRERFTRFVTREHVHGEGLFLTVGGQMRAQSWTDDHSRLVAEAAPEASGPTDAEQERTWDQIQAGLEDAPRRKRRKRRFVAAGIVVAVIAVPGGLAAGDILSARTGEYPSDAEDLRLGGPGEKLDPAGPDFRQVIEEETADIPFPNEQARKVSIDSHVRDAQRGNPAPGTQAVTTGAIRGWTAIHAVCSWSNEWVRALGADDDAARERSARMLLEAPTWTAITDLDPEQEFRTTTMDVEDPQTGETTTETISDPTQYYYLRLVSQAVEAGDIEALATTLADNAYCIGPSLVPDFRQALPAGFQGR